MSGRQAFLGTGFDALTLEQAVAAVLARPAESGFAYVVTPNADHLARLRRAPALAGLYRDAWLCLLDSRLLGNLARLAGLPHPPVVTGADLAAALLARLGGRSVAVIGMAPPAFARMAAAFPGIAFRHHAPPMRLSRDPAALAEAAAFAAEAGADFTFVALGSPLQETLCARIAAGGRARGTGLCVGAALGFLAGAGRAPGWMRAAGLEWLYRLLCEPRRLGRRYLVDDPPVLAALAAAALRHRLTGPRPTLSSQDR